MDIACYLLAWRFLGNAFARYALAASLAFAGFHALWEQFPPLLPDLSAYPAIAAVAGALFVGLGVGLVVRIGGACGGDDALALSISHATRWPIARCYLLTDLTVLALSLSYISVSRILYSLITVTLSSALIGWGAGHREGPLEGRRGRGCAGDRNRIIQGARRTARPLRFQTKGHRSHFWISASSSFSNWARSLLVPPLLWRMASSRSCPADSSLR